MKVTLKGSNLELTDDVREYVDQKIGELDRFVPEGTFVEARVELARTTFHHKKGDIFRAEVNLHLPGRLLRAEAEREDIFQAIVEVKNELQRDMKKYKDRQKDLKIRGLRSLKKRMTIAPYARRNRRRKKILGGS